MGLSTLSVRSWLPVTTLRTEGMKVAACTLPTCPVSVCLSLPDSAPQTRAALSQLAAKINSSLIQRYIGYKDIDRKR